MVYFYRRNASFNTKNMNRKSSERCLSEHLHIQPNDGSRAVIPNVFDEQQIGEKSLFRGNVGNHWSKTITWMKVLNTAFQDSIPLTHKEKGLLVKLLAKTYQTQQIEGLGAAIATLRNGFKENHLSEKLTSKSLGKLCTSLGMLYFTRPKQTEASVNHLHAYINDLVYSFIGAVIRQAIWAVTMCYRAKLGMTECVASCLPTEYKPALHTPPKPDSTPPKPTDPQKPRQRRSARLA